MEFFVQITPDPIDSKKVREFVSSPRSGAVVLFEGVVRDHNAGKEVTSIDYEIYESMALKEMKGIAHEMKKKWPEIKIALVHRKGLLKVGETSVVVAVSSPHRAESFEAARFGIDEIKKRAPIWKKEV